MAVCRAQGAAKGSKQAPSLQAAATATAARPAEAADEEDDWFIDLGLATAKEQVIACSLYSLGVCTSVVKASCVADAQRSVRLCHCPYSWPAVTEHVCA